MNETGTDALAIIKNVLPVEQKRGDIQKNRQRFDAVAAVKSQHVGMRKNISGRIGNLLQLPNEERRWLESQLKGASAKAPHFLFMARMAEALAQNGEQKGDVDYVAHIGALTEREAKEIAEQLAIVLEEKPVQSAPVAESPISRFPLYEEESVLQAERARRLKEWMGSKHSPQEIAEALEPEKKFLRAALVVKIAQCNLSFEDLRRIEDRFDDLTAGGLVIGVTKAEQEKQNPKTVDAPPSLDARAVVNEAIRRYIPIVQRKLAEQQAAREEREDGKDGAKEWEDAKEGASLAGEQPGEEMIFSLNELQTLGVIKDDGNEVKVVANEDGVSFTFASTRLSLLEWSQRLMKIAQNRRTS